MNRERSTDDRSWPGSDRAAHFVSSAAWTLGIAAQTHASQKAVPGEPQLTEGPRRPDPTSPLKVSLIELLPGRVNSPLMRVRGEAASFFPRRDRLETAVVPHVRLHAQPMACGRLAAMAVFGCLTLAACTETQRSVPQLPAADRVVVHKAERKLMLVHHGKVERSYHVELGLNPVGQKEHLGDSRTPEGTYRLEHSPRSDYFRSIKVSYPNRADLERARSHHWDAGGSIMIHGQPNVLKHEAAYYRTHDWTDGCIALSNADMAEVWTLTRDGLPIDILP